MLHPTPSLQSIVTSAGPRLGDLHPEPRHIFRLWQRFVESVNPLTKIVHVPTLQQRVLDASCDLDNVPAPLNAMLFTIYTLAVTSMSSDDCQSSFGESRATLLMRYRVATIRALIAADILTTTNLEALQALVLFLFADPESEMTYALTGIAMRQGRKIGLHREQASSKLSFFEREMRIRLWWPLCGMWAQTSMAHPPPLKSSLSEVGDVRLPLNVNDADLHPDMTEAPAESRTPTEMMCVLMKFEMPTWLRSSPTTIDVFEKLMRGGSAGGKLSLRPQHDAIGQIEAIYQDKYLRHLDQRIPLHGLTSAMIHLALARMRFKIHHPRGRPTGAGAEEDLTPEESDALFESALTMLEMIDFGIRSKFSSHIFTYMASKFQIDAYIYVLSELRRRPSGRRVVVAWNLVEDLYNEHPALVSDTGDSFYVALGDLTLAAWEVRKVEVLGGQSFGESDVPPQFIQFLLAQRRNGNDDSVQANTIPYTNGMAEFGPMDDIDFGWEYWNNFLHM